jgi:hypothetical protein
MRGWRIYATCLRSDWFSYQRVMDRGKEAMSHIEYMGAKALGPRFRGDDEMLVRGALLLRPTSVSCFCGRDCRALLLFRVPLGRGEQAEDQPRAPHAGACTEARAFAQGTRTCPKRTPQPAREVAGAWMPLRPRPRGCLFLWLLSFGQAKESNRPPGRRTKRTGTWVGLRVAPQTTRAKPNGFPLSRE